MAVNCCFCNAPTAKPALCDKCSRFSCEKCTITRNAKSFCARCYLESANEIERKRITNILKEKGAIKIDMAAELSFKGAPMLELSRTKSNGAESYSVRCQTKIGHRYFEPTKEQFAELWEKAAKFGYRPERIPFGERIVIPPHATQKPG